MDENQEKSLALEEGKGMPLAEMLRALSDGRIGQLERERDELRAAIRRAIDFMEEVDEFRAMAVLHNTLAPGSVRACRVCGCVELSACIGIDYKPCHWVGEDLCSACVEPAAGEDLVDAGELVAEAYGVDLDDERG